MRYFFRRLPCRKYKGITKLEIIKRGSVIKATRLRSWFEALIVDFQDRILPVDSKVALAAGLLDGAGLARGHNGELADILIAATAQTHRLSVVTLNLRDFEPLGVTCVAPF